MAKQVNISSRLIQGSQVITLHNVVAVTISNFGNEIITYRLNGIARMLPAFDSTKKIPISPFIIECSGYVFDVELSFENTTNVVLDYATLKKEC